MSENIINIGELIGHVIFVGFCVEKLMCFSNSTISAFFCMGKHYLSAESFKDMLSFRADTFRHAKFNAVSFCGANHRQGDACISRCRFKYCFTLGELARLLCFFYHPISGAVFDGTAGIGSFEFSENSHVWFFTVELIEFHKGCVSDGR